MNQYLSNVEKGNNSWKAYSLTLLSTVFGILVSSQIFNLLKLQPIFKSLFASDDMAKSVYIYMLIFGVFGIGLIVFTIAFKQFHKRDFISLVGIQNKFNLKLYLKGFVTWGTILIVGNLFSNFIDFQNFIAQFNLNNFLILFICGFIAIGIQSFFEEIFIRGYLLQAMSLRLKNTTALIISNSLLFGILHFGYGIESFIMSFIFAVSFTIVVLIQKQIEFTSGAHNAHNLILSLVFIDLGEKINGEFSWDIDWLSIFPDIMASTILVLIVYKFIKE